MSEHRATVDWKRSGEFRYETYSRAHALRFDGVSVAGNAAAGNIPKTVEPRPGVDPEQAFVVERYVDEAVGVLHKTWISRVTLRPNVTFSGTNSVKTEVLIEPC